MRGIMTLAASALAGLATAASATEAENVGWQTAGPKNEALGNGDVEALFVGGERAKAVAFLCDDKAIQARIATEATDMSRALSPTFSRARRTTGWIEIDGVRTYEGSFVYVPDRKVALPVERAVTAQLYNAAIQNQTVRVRFKGEAVPLTLPPVDDAFADFHARCEARGAL